LEKVFSWKLANDAAILDPISIEGISPSSFLPFGEEHHSKSKSGQILFIPEDCDHFFHMMRALSLFIKEIISGTSAFFEKMSSSTKISLISGKT